MIGSLLARLAMPRWLAECIGIGVLCALLVAGGARWRDHLVQQGVAQESARRDAIDAQNRILVQDELSRINAQVARARESLAVALAHLDQLKSDLDHEKAHSTALQSDLAAGRVRQSVAIAVARNPAEAQPGERAGAAGVDPGGEPATATLDGRVASDLEWARSTRNETIYALQACVAAYDAVKTAADAQEGK
jgi:hypothetical protein